MKAFLYRFRAMIYYVFLLVLAVLLAFRSMSASAAPLPEPCVEIDACFGFKYYGPTFNANNTVTLKFSVQVNCNRDLGYVAFDLPQGAKALQPGIKYQKRFNYLVGNPAQAPFRSIKFQAASGNGYRNGVVDTFRFVLSAAAFATMNTIKVQAKAAGTIGSVTFDAAGCGNCPQVYDDFCFKQDCCFDYAIQMEGPNSLGMLDFGFHLTNLCGLLVTEVNITIPPGNNPAVLDPLVTNFHDSFTPDIANPTLLRFIATPGGNAWDAGSPQNETETFVYSLPPALVNQPGNNLVTVTILTATNSFSQVFNLLAEECKIFPLFTGKTATEDIALNFTAGQAGRKVKGNAKPGEQALSIYPNPASDAGFRIKINAATHQAMIQIRDLTGKLIHSREMKNGAEAEIDAKALGMKAGIYLVSLQTRNGEVVQKLVIQ